MPPASQVLLAVPHDAAGPLRELEKATGWLNDFMAAWARRSSGGHQPICDLASGE